MRMLLMLMTACLVSTPIRAQEKKNEDGLPPKKIEVVKADAKMAVVEDAQSVHRFEVLTIDGKKQKLDAFKGKVCLIVNTASKCGLTPQYAALEKLYETYKDKGFVVLGFPANEFRGQEPGTNEEIAAFCKEKYQVTFPMFSKIVVKGEGQAPLYKFLTTESPAPGEVQWNFQKYLIDGDGHVQKMFAPRTAPDSDDVKKAVEAALEANAKKAVAIAAPAAAAKTPAGKKFVGGPTVAADHLADALKRAGEAKKVVFLHFSADWCGWCKKLEAFMARPEIKPILEKDFIDLRIDTDTMQDGQSTLDKYTGGRPTGIPFIVFLKPDGTVVMNSFARDHQNTGYPSKPEEIDHFMKMMNAAATNASKDDLAVIEKTLRSLGSK